MVEAITKSAPRIFERISRLGMATTLMAAQLFVAIIAVNQFPGSVHAASTTRSASVSTNVTVPSGKAWIESNNLHTEDGASETVVMKKNQESDFLYATSFGFSIPTDATINGINAVMKRSASVADTISDKTVQLLKSNTLVGGNKASASSWPASLTSQVYGTGTTDMWGTSWTPTDVNSIGFGLAIAIQNTSNDNTDRTSSVDYVSITIDYTEAVVQDLPPVDEVDEEVDIVIPDKVTICHRTNSITNPYRKITVDASAVDGEGNNDHSHHDEYGIFDPAVHTQSGDDWADIIPSVPGLTEGLNWDELGQSIYDNDCVFPTIESTGTVIITKIVDPSESSEKFAFDSEDLDIEDEELGHNELITRENIAAGVEYIVSENNEAGYDLTSIVCSAPGITEFTYDDDLDTESVSFTLPADATVTCVFTNTQDDDEPQLGTVNVLKYEDFNRNGLRDEDEPTLEGWEITLDCANFTESVGIEVSRDISLVDDCTQRSEITDENGEAVFDGVEGNILYMVDEVIGDDRQNWQQTGIVCSVRTIREDVALLQVVDSEIQLPENMFIMDENSTVDCEIGNARDIVLELAKLNDADAPRVRGNIVTYTLIVTHPEDSSVSYDTIVTDLPPENFEYNGVYTFELTTASLDRDTPLNVPDPNYQSPGQWQLGTFYPGEVVTLTYQTVINNQVSPGEYPDVAFVRGFTQPEEGIEVLGNSAENPFVQTDVTVILGQTIGDVTFQPTTAVLGTLINTGERVHPLHYLLPLTIIANALLLIQLTTRTSVQKGAK